MLVCAHARTGKARLLLNPLEAVLPHRDPGPGATVASGSGSGSGSGNGTDSEEAPL